VRLLNLRGFFPILPNEPFGIGDAHDELWAGSVKKRFSPASVGAFAVFESNAVQYFLRLLISRSLHKDDGPVRDLGFRFENHQFVISHFSFDDFGKYSLQEKFSRTAEKLRRSDFPGTG
jgi:hypothetical protein